MNQTNPKPKTRHKRKYCRFWYPVLAEFGLTPSEGLLMTLITDLSVRRGYCYSGKEVLGKHLNMTRQTVHGHIKRLVAYGLLAKVRDHNIRASCFAPTDQWRNFKKWLEDPMRPDE